MDIGATGSTRHFAIDKSRHAQGEIHDGGVDAEQDAVIDRARAMSRAPGRLGCTVMTPGRADGTCGGEAGSTTSSENCSTGADEVARPTAAVLRAVAACLASSAPRAAPGAQRAA